MLSAEWTGLVDRMLIDECDDRREGVVRIRRCLDALGSGTDVTDIHADLARQGYLFPSWAAPVGAVPNPPLVARELTRAGLPELPHVVTDVALTALEATEHELTPFIQDWKAGRSTALLLWTEEASGSSLAGIATEALPSNGGWLLHGVKRFSRHADLSSGAVVVAVTAEHELALFAADARHPTVTKHPVRSWNGSAFYDVVLEDTPAVRITRSEEEARSILLAMASRERLGLDYLGKLERVEASQGNGSPRSCRVAAFIRAGARAPSDVSPVTVSQALKWYASTELSGAIVDAASPTPGSQALSALQDALEATLSAGSSETLLDDVAAQVLSDPGCLWNAVTAQDIRERCDSLAALRRFTDDAPQTLLKLIARSPSWLRDVGLPRTILGDSPDCIAVVATFGSEVDLPDILAPLQQRDGDHERATLILDACHRLAVLQNLLGKTCRHVHKRRIGQVLLSSLQVARHQLCEVAVSIAAEWSFLQRMVELRLPLTDMRLHLDSMRTRCARWSFPLFHLGGAGALVSPGHRRSAERLLRPAPRLRAIRPKARQENAQTLSTPESAAIEVAREVVGRREWAALLPSQERFLYLTHSEGHKPDHVLVRIWRTSRPVSEKTLRAITFLLSCRHPVLRTQLTYDGAPRQRTVPPSKSLVDVVTGTDPTVTAILADLRRPFALDRGQVMRLLTATLPDGTPVLGLGLHHVAGDGVTLNVLERDIDKLLALPLTGEVRRDGPETGWEGTLPPICAEASQRLLAWNDRDGGAAQFWKRYLSGASLGLLPRLADRDRDSQSAVTYRIDVESSLSKELARYTAETQTTPFQVLSLAAGGALCHMSGQSSSVFATTVDIRPHLGLPPDTIGPYINTVPVRVDRWSPGDASHAMAAHRAACWDLLSGARTPYQRIRDLTASVLDLPGDLQTCVEVQNRSDAEAEHLAAIGVDPETAWFDLTVIGVVGQGLESLVLTRRTGTLAGWQVEAFSALVLDGIRHICGLARIASRADCPDHADRISRPRGSQPRELKDDPPTRFLAHAAGSPADPALVSRSATYSYGQLADMARAVADRLAAAGIRPGDRVAIDLPRGVELVAEVLGAALVGATAVPLEPAHPAGRKVRIIHRVGCVAVHDGGGLRRVSEPERSAEGERDRRPDQRAHGFAYILATSGSTGEPKAVAVSWSNLRTLVDSIAEVFELGRSRRMLNLASPSFDVFMMEVWSPLATGGVVCTFDGSPLDDEALTSFINESGAEVADIPPRILARLDPVQCRGLQLVSVGGESFPQQLVNEWSSSSRRFLNTYGPTEATVISTAYECKPSEDTLEPPIGGAIPGMRTHVVDERLRLCPVGVPGELWVCGDCVAAGYYGDPGQTAVKFVACPFDCRPGARAYRTGDMCVQRPDGELQYLGRADGQVQVGGVRVEIGEVENALGSCTGVRECAVLLFEEPSNELAAVCVFTGGTDLRSVQRELAERLPSAFRPRRWLEVDSIPLTASGKIDATAIRNRLRSQRSSAPLTGRPPVPSERQLGRLAALIAECCGREVSSEDEWLHLGLSSLQMAVLSDRIRGELQVPLRVPDVMRTRTVGELMAMVDDLRGVEASGAGSGVSTENPIALVVPPTTNPWVYREVVRKCRDAVTLLESESAGVVPQQGPSQRLDLMIRHVARSVVGTTVGIRSGRVVAGWSMGAAIAQEVVHRLNLVGVPHRHLVLIDPPHPNYETPAGQPDGSGDSGSEPPTPGTDDVSGTGDDIYQMAAEALATWRVREVETPTTLLLSSENPYRNRWRALLPHARQLVVPGDHYTILRDAGADAIAAVLERAIADGGHG